jgi:hypothetical protein
VSKSTILAAGQITNHDNITVELVKASETPPAVLIRWPEAPSVLAPNAQALAAVASAMVRLMAEAQAQLAQLRRRRR